MRGAGLDAKLSAGGTLGALRHAMRCRARRQCVAMAARLKITCCLRVGAACSVEAVGTARGEAEPAGQTAVKSGGVRACRDVLTPRARQLAHHRPRLGPAPARTLGRRLKLPPLAGNRERKGSAFRRWCLEHCRSMSVCLPACLSRNSERRRAPLLLEWWIRAPATTREPGAGAAEGAGRGC
jgi:hypothetical protein